MQVASWDRLPALERLLRTQLTAIKLSDAVLGAQVAVFDYGTGTVLANVAVGERGALDPRPVTPGTLFPLFGCSRLVAAAAVAGLVAENGVSWEDRVDRYWPAWGKAGKGGCTVGELLRGRSGVEGVLPADVSTAHFSPGRWDDCAGEIAAAEPLVLPGLIAARASRSRGASLAARASFLDGGSAAAAGAAAADASPLVDPLPTIAEGAELAVERSGSVAGALGSPAAVDSPLATNPTAAKALAPYFAHGRPQVGPPSSMESTCHLWFGWGWAVGTLVAGMARAHGFLPADALTANGLNAVLDGKFGRSQGMSEQVSFGLRSLVPTTAAAVAAAANATLPSAPAAPGADVASAVAAGGTGPAALPSINVATVCLGGSGALDGVAVPAAAAATDPAESSDVREAMEDKLRKAQAPASLPAGAGAVDSEDNAVTMSNALAAMELAEAMTEAGLNDLTALTAGGREHFMDPRVVNMHKVRAAVLPALNCYASAMGLARAGAYLATNGVASPAGGSALPAGPVTIGNTLYDPAAVWVAHHAGLRLYSFDLSAGDGAVALPSTIRHRATAFGCSGLGGSRVMVDTHRRIAIAITVNRLTADGSVAAALLDGVVRDLGLSGRL